MEDEPVVADSAGHTMIDIEAIHAAEEKAAEAAAKNQREQEEAA